MRERKGEERDFLGRTAVIRRGQKTTEDTVALVEIENKQTMELSLVKNILSQPRLEEDLFHSSSSEEEQDDSDGGDSEDDDSAGTGAQGGAGGAYDGVSDDDSAADSDLEDDAG